MLLYYFNSITMKKRILLVDDDALLNKINKEILFKAGLASELNIATNGRQAVDYLKEQIASNSMLPDLIILDLDMPVMNGFAFIDEFNNLDFPGKGNIEIVVFSDSSSPADKHRVFARGIRNFIDKPYLLRGLTDLLRRMHWA